MEKSIAKVSVEPARAWKWDEVLLVILTCLLLPYAIIFLPIPLTLPPAVVKLLFFGGYVHLREEWIWMTTAVIGACDLALVFCRPYDRRHAWSRILMLAFAGIVFAPFLLAPIFRAIQSK